MKLILDVDIEQILSQIKGSDLVKKAVLIALTDVRAEIEEQIDRYDDRNISEYEDCLAIINCKIDVISRL